MTAAPTGLTVHVLDTARGVPAAGMAVTLVGPDGSAVDAVTDDDGRTATPLVAALIDGAYELTFAVGPYYAGSGLVDDDGPAYLDLVPVRVHLTAAMGHVHVALLVTPWSYTTYRGT